MAESTTEPVRVGQRVTWERRVSEADIEAFAHLSGDVNAVHLDDSYAARTRFGSRVAHGVLTVAFVSKVIGTQLVGPGHTAIYMEQNARFLRPVKAGDTIVVEAEVTEYDPVKHRARLTTTAALQDGTQVMTGTALVLIDPHPFS